MSVYKQGRLMIALVAAAAQMLCLATSALFFALCRLERLMDQEVFK